MKKWYVIKVASGKERKIKELIESELKRNSTENIISNLLIPYRKEIQLRKGKKVHIEKNFFPGYIFQELHRLQRAHIDDEVPVAEARSPLGQEHLRGRPVQLPYHPGHR